MPHALLALGSNLGDRCADFRQRLQPLLASMAMYGC